MTRPELLKRLIRVAHAADAHDALARKVCYPMNGEVSEAFERVYSALLSLPKSMWREARKKLKR